MLFHAKEKRKNVSGKEKSAADDAGKESVMCKKFFLKKTRGSFTMEAAAVIPITLILVVSLLFLAFFAHDMVTLDAVCSDMLFDNAGTGKDTETVSAGEAEERLHAGLIHARNAALNIAKEGNGLHAEGNADFPLPFALMRTFFGTAAEKLHTDYDIRHLDARKEILGYKALSDGAETLLER